MIRLLLVALLLGSASAGAAEPDGVLRGLVFDGRSAAPARGIRVAVDGWAIGQRTSEDGAFQLALPPGRYRLTFDGGSRSAPIPVRAGQSTEVIVTLDPDGGAARLDVEAPAAAASQPTSRPVAEGPRVVVRGRVVDAAQGRPVVGARVFVQGTPLEGVTGKDGGFGLELNPGQHRLTVVHPSYSTETLEKLEVGPGGVDGLEVRMTPAAVQLADMVVTAPKVVGSSLTLLEERRAASAVEDMIGAEQMAKSGDGDASEALKRVTGVTVVGGKYVYVRGLGERYSSTLLNGATLPSPEPERRVVPLDMFPTDMLKSVVIQKTYSPDMPAEFGGGAVQLRTRDYPMTWVSSVSLSSGMTAGSTFAKGIKYRGGGLDWLGFDAGTRALPDAVARASDGSPLLERDMFSERGYTARELERFGEAMPDVWNLTSGTVWPNLGFSGTVGTGGTLLGRKAGFLTSVTYDNDWLALQREMEIFVVGGGGKLEPAHSYHFDELKNTVTLAGILSAGIDLTPRQKLRLTTLVDRITDNEARQYEGFNRDVGTNIRVSRLRWVERMLLASQLRGEHALLPRQGIDLGWSYTLSLATRSEPDRREVRYDQEQQAADVWLLSDRPEGNQRLHSGLSDVGHDVGLNVSWAFKQWSDLAARLRAGGNVVVKDREVNTRRYKFQHKGPKSGDTAILSLSPEEIFTPENIGPDGFQFEEITRQTDNYEASQRVWATWAALDLPLLSWLRLAGGVRLESSTQRVLTYELFNPELEPVTADLGTVDVLPSATVSLTPLRDHVLRLGYSRTVSRPDFRELSPATFNDVTGGRQIFGNPDLERALIDNVDLRWEWYFTRGESVSLALFYKRFTRPIETIVEVSAQHSVTYANADGADNLGGELEGRKSFGFIHRALRDLHVGANAALIHSRVDLPEDQGIQTSSSRPLQGQSPFAVNLQLGYDNVDIGTAATLLYNVFGARIDQVGALGAPDIYEEPVHQLDLVVKQKLTRRLSLSFKAKNLIDPLVRLTQGERTTESYRRGRAFSVALSGSI